MKSFSAKARRCATYRSLRTERLEPRAMLHSGPAMWAADGDLTLSFAPDGTDIAGAESSLFATLNALAPEAEWQEAVLRAFQTWASNTAASIGVVEDSGDGFGVAGASRGDARFGDIRIGAAPLDDGVLAIAIPSTDLLSGTWVGDVIINSSAAFASLDELFAVALHEAGHVLGLEHSDDPNSPMHVHGAIPVATLTPADIFAVQAIYGSPQSHLNEGATTNDTLSNATPLRLNSTLSGGPGSAPSLTYGAITASADADYFRLTSPQNHQGAVEVTLRTAGISLLAPHLALFDSNGHLLSESVSLNATGASLTVSLSAPPSDGQILVRVTGARNDEFGVGDYALVAAFDGLNQVSADVIAAAADGALRSLSQQELEKVLRETTPNVNERTGDDDVAGAVTLTPSRGFTPNSRYEVLGSIGSPGDVDFVKVTPPVIGGGTMTIRVRALEPNGMTPKIVVFGKNNQPRPATVLVNGHGELVVQVTGDGSNESVSFSISAADASGPRAVGGYQLVVDFNGEPIELDSALAGVITAEAPVRETPFYVALPHLFHFALEVPPAPAAAQAVVMVTIRDAEGNVVFRVASRPGETHTAGSVLLAPGTYRIQAAALTAEPLTGDVAFTLYAKASSGPFAANPDDPTYQPEFQCEEPGHEGLYCYPGHFTSPDPYLWEDFTESLPELPEDQTFQQLVESLLVEWWTWLWEQMGVNGPPLARSDTVDLSQQAAADGEQLLTIPLNVLDNDIEPEEEPVIAILRSTTAHGQLALHPDGTFDYTPDDGFEGVDSFRYIAFDSTNESSEATVRIYVGFRGDYDGSGTGDGRDLLAWQRTLGQTVTPAGSGADGDGDGVVTMADGLVWSFNFGVTRPEASGAVDDRGDGELLQIEPSAATALSDDLLVAPARTLDDVTYALGGPAVVLSGETLSIQPDSELRQPPEVNRWQSMVSRLDDAADNFASTFISTATTQQFQLQATTDASEHAIDRAFGELFTSGLSRLRHGCAPF